MVNVGSHVISSEDAARLLEDWFSVVGRAVLVRMGVRSQHDQDDILQTACLAFWAAYVVKRQGLAYPRAAMGTIVKRLVYRFWRSRELVVDVATTEVATESTDTETADALMDFRWLLERFPAKVEMTREAVRVWVEMGGPKYEDVAEQLGISVDQVRGAIYSFKRWLKRYVEETEAD